MEPVDLLQLINAIRVLDNDGDIAVNRKKRSLVRLEALISAILSVAYLLIVMVKK